MPIRSSHLLHDVAHWRLQAEEIRTAADNMTDADCRQVVMQIADEYDLLADAAEKRAKREQEREW
jgi:hypothetical protein